VIFLQNEVCRRLPCHSPNVSTRHSFGRAQHPHIDVWVGIASLLSAADDWLVSRKLADHLVGLVGVHVFEGLPRLEPLVAAA
jgi:hypothetical protein